MYKVYYRFNKLHVFFRLLLVVIGGILFFGIGIHFIEPRTYHSPVDGIWWAIETISTVGYGDLVPRSLAGRFFATLLILIGAAFVTYYYASLASFVIKKQTVYELGNARFTDDGHIIIVGWNERAKQIIESLKTHHANEKIVVIDETLELKPKKQGHFFFIRGDATSQKAWKQANIEKSRMVILTADPNKNERTSDMNTITSLLAIRGLNENVICLCEILTPIHLPNAIRAGADQIIESNMIISEAIVDKITEGKPQ